MKRFLILLALASLPVFSQQTLRWSATTGDTILVGAGTTATIQQLATNAPQTLIDQIVIYCSVACSISQSANGSAATTTAGTVRPLLPTPLNTTVPINFFTASNVGGGTAQGGTIHLPEGSTVVLCLNTSCGASGNITLGTGGTASNWSVTIGTITGTANITFYGRTIL